ncbi:potassium-transporting ATPase subunit KdpA [Clostridium manihotivorum]|uniref:Potassium-transporting ATPase potassium-binding subunit n=1 Tax=Clostridium manihotivorum TaxID=2320868 RepID=A0A410DW95_9CLOT|nr:potassium-transporting ATPase subunit KdpA [Clostridium manihotivorum]QAA33301.1 potassium-transporting ATPase subunit KdpA [Clostridium manihotivorum]
MDILQIVLTLILFILLVVPMGKYLYTVATGEKSFGDPIFDKVDNFIFKVGGINKEEMSWKKYAISLLVCNAIMAIIAYVILRIQWVGLLNPNHISGMEQSLSFNTAISFITNTNLQDYSGESSLSYFSQMIVIIFMMFTSAASGFGAALAFIRALTGEKKTVGNFFVDIVRIITRVFIPLSVIVAVILMWQGVPQTLSANITVHTIEGKLQDIALGPVAALEAIKHIGTNGGGFFGANSAHPFENPSAISNLIELLSMMLLPGALVYTFGLMVKNKRQGWTIFAAMALLFILVLPIAYTAEKAGNPGLISTGLSQSLGNMEGKEVRFGVAQSSLFTTVTTAFTTGSVNNMHDSLTPLGGMVALWNMMLNVVFGGKGVGLMSMLMYAILSVFLCGLMIGRTPEFLRKKIEGKEMKLIALAIIIHPLIILLPSAFSLVINSGLAGITNPGYHGLSQVLYQYASSAANNGSGFEGLIDNTAFWNTATGIVMLLGRYVSMILLLAVGGSLAEKQLLPENEAAFKTDNKMFIVILVAVVIIIGALTFLPALVLGPVSEHLTIGR